MKDIKLVIFDLDGTLVNAYPAINRSFNYTMRSLRYPRQKAGVIRRAVGWGDENLLKPFVAKKDLKKAAGLYRAHHRHALIEDSRLFPQAAVVLANLKSKGYILAVASNRPTRFSRILLRHLKLGKYFDYVLCADKLKTIKPHPEILNKIMRRFSLRPHQAVFVGDMSIDAQAARRAGVKGIMVTTGSSTRAQIKKERPYKIINKIIELLDVLR